MRAFREGGVKSVDAGRPASDVARDQGLGTASMFAEVLSIGSELVSGQGLDTNSQWLSQALGDVGIPVRFHTTLGDDLGDNVAAFRIAVGRADLVLATGGLGPTQDDLTREALAQLAGVPLVEEPALLEAIAAIFERI